MSIRGPAEGRVRGWLVASASIAILAVYCGALMISEERLNLLGREDELIENAGALFFAGAATAFLLASLLAARNHGQPQAEISRRPAVYALLALLMLVCCGEEISWGQRLFGWRTPELIADHNAQNETNLHNLRPVHQWHPDGSEKSFVGKLVNMNRLFSLVWLCAFVILPAGVHAVPSVRRGLAGALLPWPPVWPGILFLTSYAAYKVVAHLYAGTIRAHALDELKEASYAAIYAVIALVALAAEARRSSSTTEGMPRV